MPNTCNYAERWDPELIETLIQNTLTSPFITTNVKWVGAKTFHFTRMSTTGYKPHSRNGGWNRGTFTQTDVPYTLTHDRDVEFLVDVLDVDETNETASIRNISNTFEMTQAAPETDALFFSKVAAVAKANNGYSASSADSAWTAANVYTKLKEILAAGKLRRYKARGTLVAYVASFIMDLLERSTEFTRTIDVTTIAEGGAGIETRVTSIDSVPFIEVIDDERFYDAFNFNPENGGFVPATGAHKLHVLVACGDTCKTVPKHQSIYFFAPGSHTEGDGYLYQNRSCSDTFVFPNGNGEYDSVYAEYNSTAVA